LGLFEILVNPNIDVYTLESDPGAPYSTHPLNLGEDEPFLFLLRDTCRAAIHAPDDRRMSVSAGAEEQPPVGSSEERLK